MGFFKAVFAKVLVKLVIVLPILIIWAIIVGACKGTVCTKDDFTGKQLYPKESDQEKKI